MKHLFYLFFSIILLVSAVPCRQLSYRSSYLLPEIEQHISIEDIMTTADLLIGPSAETLLVTSNETQIGNLFVIGDGVVIVDGAEYSLHGSLWQEGNGTVIIRNGAYLHVMQEYLSQYPHFMHDNSLFHAEDAIIYANSVYRTFLYDSSTYIARRTDFPFWNFRECFDMSTLILEDANMVGDLLIRDSCTVSMTRCDTILPWFCATDGVVMDIEFPDYNFIEHFEFNSFLTGVSGVKYSAVFDSCNILTSGVDVFPGCDVTVRNSIFDLAVRIPDSDTLHLSNISNQTYYPYLSIPFSDRIVRLVNTYLQLWCVYTFDNAVLYMDSCYWGESHAKDNSTIIADACSTNGFPSSVTSTEDGRFEFKNGKVLAFVSSWNNATTYLENVWITPCRPGIAQITNIAHQSSKMLCSNCEFDTLPYAMDTALVMFAAIDTIEGFHIIGDAWLDVGPFSDIEFSYYSLYWSEMCSIDWHLISDSTEQIFNDTLGTCEWTIHDEDFLVRLVIFTTEGESLSAIDTFFYSGTDIPIERQCTYSLEISPNPFNSSCMITVDVGSIHESPLQVEIYDLRGNVVMPYSDGKPSSFVPLIKGNRGDASASTQGIYIWAPDESISSGIYLVRATTEDERTVTTRVVYVR